MPGGCGRINTARLLDYGEQLDRWKQLAEALCAVTSASAGAGAASSAP